MWLYECQVADPELTPTNFFPYFQAVYPRMSTDVAPRLHDLYGDFRAFLLQGHKVDVLDSLRGFFDGLFPSVYYHALNPKLTDFTDDYKVRYSAPIASFSKLQTSLASPQENSLNYGKSRVTVLIVIVITRHRISPRKKKKHCKISSFDVPQVTFLKKEKNFPRSCFLLVG